ncbi:MAG TPA: hypothetical protein VIW22_04665 [Nitrososphaerales archaeon]
MADGKLGNFLLFIGLMFVGVSIVYTGIGYLLGGAPTDVSLAVIAVGITMFIAGALLARHYL